jgi:hypothetical protein
MNELATAYITQHTGQNGKTPWVVFNTNKEPLVELPSHLNEHEAMALLEWARSIELKAFNAGIKYNKNVLHEDTVKSLQEIVRELRRENFVLLEENERIGQALDKEVSKEY